MGPTWFGEPIWILTNRKECWKVCVRKCVASIFFFFLYRVGLVHRILYCVCINCITSRHGNGRGGDGFCHPRPHPLIPYIYTLPYPYPTGMRNWISSPSPMGSGIPISSPSPQWINFFDKKRVFLSFNDNIVVHYPTICVHFNIYLPNNSVAPLTINESSLYHDNYQTK